MKKTFIILLTVALTIASVVCTGCAKPEADAKTESDSSVISFKTQDINGKDIDSAELFADNKITAINIWASWCGPCVNELPELQKLSSELEALDCRLISILYDGDADSGVNAGKQLIDQAGLTYAVLLPNDSVRSQFSIRYFPTTVFVDSSGRLVGEPIIGAQVDEYLPAVQRLLEQKER